MKHTDYICTKEWFAWRPVRLDSGEWVWLDWVEKTTDDRPLVYLGLLTEYSYKRVK